MAIVETSSGVLSIESFSYSWLINLKPSLESVSDSFRAALDSSDESSFIDMYPNMPPSRRFQKLNNNNPNFDFGHPLREQYVATTIQAEEAANGENGGTRPGCLAKRKQLHCSSLRRCRCLLSRKLFEKYLYFLGPFLEKLRFCRSKSRKGSAGENRVWIVKNNSSMYSPQASPRTSVGSSVGDWRRSCDSESSIHEAVLHCKRSIGM